MADRQARRPQQTVPPAGSMDLVAGVEGLRPALGRLFVVVGVFDGLHLGHAYLLENLRREAGARGARPTVVTFDHHPDEILLGTAPPLLCDPEERLTHIAAAGVEVTVIQPFNETVRRTEYDAFVALISRRIDLAGFLMTPDSAFGFERRGTPAALTALGHREGFDVVVIPQFELDGRPVRSTDIRSAIAAGDLETARRLLGRPVTVVGDAQPAGRRARITFGLPVALPPLGTYPAMIHAAGRERRSMRADVMVADGALRVPKDVGGRVSVVFE
jgi:riboflavin kinase / FMN adenylyltransferase